jgi:magnesium-transporting ATPase (P-type)
LETDWNSIITLKDPEPGEVKKESTDSKKPKIQKLPVGISCIQKHIDEVDNVPLLVRLYCDATPENKAHLIEILQNNGEMVFSFGQATNPQHYLSQVQSDFSMGMLPYVETNENESTCTETSFPLQRSLFSPTRAADHDSFHSDDESFTEEEKPHTIIDVDEFLEAKAARSKTLMSHLLQLSSTLISEDHHFIQTSLELLKMGRYLLQNAQMSLWFLFGASLAIQVHQTLTAVFLVAASLDAIMLLWLIVVIVPLIAGSLLSTPPQPKLMKLISDKNVPIPSKKVVRIGLYFTARALPSAIASLAVFVLSMRSLWTAGGIPEVFGVVEPADLTAFGQKQFIDALAFSQNLCLFSLVLCISSYTLCQHPSLSISQTDLVFSVTSSMSFHSRTRSIFKFNPFRNTEWVVTCVVAVVLQVIFLLIYLRDILSHFTQIDWFVYVIIFGWPILVIFIDDFVKRRERSHWKLNQEMLRLEFETKLGMHSPI